MYIYLIIDWFTSYYIFRFTSYYIEETRFISLLFPPFIQYMMCLNWIPIKILIIFLLKYLTSLCSNDIIISTCKTKGGFPIYWGETVFFYSFLQVRYFSYHAVR